MQNFIQQQSLILMQALLGVISPNFRMITINERDEKLIVNIVLGIEDQEDLEEIEDLESEFEALQESPVDFDFIVTITAEDLEWPEDNTLVVFRRKEN